MKGFPIIPLVLSPLLVACDPAAIATIPLSGPASVMPGGQSGSQTKAKRVMAEVAYERGYAFGGTMHQTGAPLLWYTKEMEGADVTMSLRRNLQDQNLEIEIVDFPAFTRSEESHQLEAEIRSRLP